MNQEAVMTENSSLHRAKHPATPLAGPYGHPLHPMLVTVPIGAWTASLVFDLVAFFGEDPAVFAVGARWLIAIGLVGAVAAGVVGLMDLSRLDRGTRARKTGLTHLTLNSIAIVLFAVSFVVRLGDDGATFAGFVLSVIGILVVAASGFLGGELVFRAGVRVADEATQAEHFVR